MTSARDFAKAARARTNNTPPERTFTMFVDANNDAFVPDAGPELARILREVAKRLENGEDVTSFQTIFDVNGNDVGRFALKNATYRSHEVKE